MALAALLAGWREPRSAILFGGALIVTWTVAAILIATDVRDADGFMDCWTDCTILQDGVEFALFVSPVMLVVVLIGRLAAWLTRRVRH